MKDIIVHFKKLYNQKELLINMIWRNLKGMYQGSVLGLSWAIIVPLIMMAVINFVFSKVMRIEIDNFPLFALSGLLPWFFFVAAVQDSARSISSNAPLLHQFTISKEILPLSYVGANFINFIYGLIFVLPFFIFFRIKHIDILIFLPLVLLTHFIFTTGVCLFFAWLNVYIKDTVYLLNLCFMFLFWMTPVFYSIDMIPAQYRWICDINPMSIYITMYRDVLYYARIEIGTFFIGAIIASAVLLAGYFSFLKNEKFIIKKI